MDTTLKDYLTVSEIAALHGKTRQAILYLVKTRKVDYKLAGKTILVPREEIEKLI